MNRVILDINFCLLLSPILVQLLDDVLLLFKGDVPIEDLTVKSLDVGLDIGQLVFRDLKVCLGSQTHIGDQLKSSLVLVQDLLDFRFSILFNLTHSLLIIPLHRLDVLLQVSDLLILLRHGILMSLLLLVHLFSMTFIDLSLGIAELTGLFLLLFLEGLVASCVLKHLLRV